MTHLTSFSPFLIENGNIFFEKPAFRELVLSIAPQGAVLADPKVIEKAASLQEALGPAFSLIPIFGGKSRATKEALEDELFKKKLGRDCLLIGVGGGVVTDLVGYLASTYMRGVPLILVPTTLLAMVDAAIGGKNGIDTPFGKNLIGTFYIPKAIFIDLDFLQTLPEKEGSNGLAEILKYGLTLNPAIWERIEKNAAAWRERENLEWLIRSSMEAKTKVVQEDPQETKGFRRTLNFGHTVGHALELLSDFSIDHGQAVALGSMSESYLSHRLGFLSGDSLARILALYRKLGFALKLPNRFSPSAFKEALAMDKKSKGNKPRCVLIDAIGSAVSFEGTYCRPIEEKEMDDLIHWMRTYGS